MKLSEWAKQQGIAYKSAWRMWKLGQLPMPADQLPTGTIIVHPHKAPAEGRVALYARVSSSDQKNDLEAQMGRLVTFATGQSLTVGAAVCEIGSGLNGRRPKLMKLLADQQYIAIVVEHRDRLMRFGIEYVEAALKAQGRKIVVIDESEMKDDLVQDMIEVLTSFCVRLYGRRSAKNKAKKALKALGEDQEGEA